MKYRAANGAYVAVPAQKDASLVGKTSVFQIQRHDQGLPMSLGVVVQKMISLVINERGAKVVKWMIGLCQLDPTFCSSLCLNPTNSSSTAPPPRSPSYTVDSEPTVR
jgi:hypothetical protein